MKRRELLWGLGVAGLWLPSATAQQAMPRLGLLSGTPFDEREFAALRQGLGETGFVEGRNLAIEYRTAGGHYDRLPALAANLVDQGVAVILATGGTASAVAAKAATATIPIVFANGGDPVATALVSSLNHPGGNVTGVTFFVTALGAKRLEILRELLPTATAIGLLINRRNPNAGAETKDVEAAAQALGRRIHVQNGTSEGEIDTAFAEFAAQGLGGVMVAADAFFLSRREQLAAAATKRALPTIYPVREHVVAGGLISYGTDRHDAYRHGGVYAGKVLRGEKPADLPVMQSVKFELVVNAGTAKALNLTIPPTLLARADEVIE